MESTSTALTVIYEFRNIARRPFPTIPDSDLVKSIREFVGVPANSAKKVSRSDLHLADNYKVHLDIGGEGQNEHMGLISGFAEAINVNAATMQSNQYGIPIPNLVQVNSWDNDPSYPFADGFADYITMQNAPLTPHNIDEIARCLRPGGTVELWIAPDFRDDINLLAEELNSRAEFDVVDEFNGSTGHTKVRIVSGIKPMAQHVVEAQNIGKQPVAAARSKNCSEILLSQIGLFKSGVSNKVKALVEYIADEFNYYGG